MWHHKHNDLCEVCGAGGYLLCCDYCNLGYCLTCFTPPVDPTDVSKYSRWACPECTVQHEECLLAAKGIQLASLLHAKPPAIALYEVPIPQSLAGTVEASKSQDVKGVDSASKPAPYASPQALLRSEKTSASPRSAYPAAVTFVHPPSGAAGSASTGSAGASGHFLVKAEAQQELLPPNRSPLPQPPAAPLAQRPPSSATKTVAGKSGVGVSSAKSVIAASADTSSPAKSAKKQIAVKAHTVESAPPKKQVPSVARTAVPVVVVSADGAIDSSLGSVAIPRKATASSNSRSVAPASSTIPAPSVKKTASASGRSPNAAAAAGGGRKQRSLNSGRTHAFAAAAAAAVLPASMPTATSGSALPVPGSLAFTSAPLPMPGFSTPLPPPAPMLHKPITRVQPVVPPAERHVPTHAAAALPAPPPAAAPRLAQFLAKIAGGPGVSLLPPP